jgi:hypothetical protein
MQLIAMQLSGDYYATNSGTIPYPESACNGKKDGDDSGKCGLTVRMHYDIEGDYQSFKKGKQYNNQCHAVFPLRHDLHYLPTGTYNVGKGSGFVRKAGVST